MNNPNFKRHALAVAISLACVNAQASNTEWVTTLNGQSVYGSNRTPSISADGNIVAFSSSATELVNNQYRGFLILAKDLSNNSIKVANINNQGEQDNGLSLDPRISSNGRYVLFESTANNLDPADTDTDSDVYLHDLVTRETKLISSNASGQSSNADSQDGRVSDDGRYAVFTSLANNLVSTNTNGKRQIYLKDMVTGQVELISANAAGQAGDGDSFGHVISSDGRYIAFNSISNNLDNKGSVSQYDIYVYDRLNKTVERLGQAIDGGLKNNHSSQVSISDDGRVVAFLSIADNLLTNDNNGLIDIFVLDRKNNTIQRVQGSAEPNGMSVAPKLSKNGRFVTFYSSASNLVSGDTNAADDQFIFDRFTNEIQLVSVDANGNQIHGKVDTPADINADGSAVVFATADALEAGDTNNQLDIYKRHLDPPVNVAPVAKALQPLSQSCDNGGAYVTLDASQSYDPDNQNLSFSWSGPFGTLTGAVVDAFFEVGNHVVTLTVTDSSGGTSNDSITVAVIDNEAPVVVADAQVILEATTTQGAPLNLGYNAYDNCSLAGGSVNPTPQYYPMGTTAVTITAFDTAGNTTSKQTNVIVQDTTPPVITAPTNKVVEANAAGMSVDIGTAQANDIFPVTVSNDAPSLFPIGQNIVTWTATDANGNKSNVQQQIVVQDTIAPTLTPYNSNVVLEATSRAGAEYSVLYDVSDSCIGCGNIDVVMVPNLSIFPLGNTSVNISAIDHAGNSTQQQVSVLVQDTTPPVLTVPNDIQREANDINSTLNIGQATASDIFDVVINNDAPVMFALGDTQITWTATDSNGNSASGVQRVSISDTTAPVLTLPTDITVEANARLSTVDIGSATATDIFDVSISNDAPTNFPLGDTIVNWLATDANGNSSSGKQTVHVVDTTAPQLNLPADVIAEASGASTAVNLGQASATDIFNVSISNNGLAAYPLGDTLVTWTASDENGNVTQKQQNVRIVDTSAPVVDAGADMTIEATAVTGAAFVPSYQASDVCDCGDLSINISPSQAMYALGQHVITVSATDISGNTGSDSMVLKVVDTTKPVLNVPQDILMEATGEFTLVNIGQAAASDIFAVSIQNDAPASFPLGTTAIHWTATDANGNSTTVIQNVTIVDTTAPTFELNVEQDDLWAPHHKMVLAAKVENIHDLVDTNPMVDIQISSNGDHKRHSEESDWEVVESNGEWLIYLRAEKNHRGEDRIYSISVNVTDFSGNTSTQTTEVTVDKSRGHHKKNKQDKKGKKDRKDKHKDKRHHDKKDNNSKKHK